MAHFGNGGHHPRCSKCEMISDPTVLTHAMGGCSGRRGITRLRPCQSRHTPRDQSILAKFPVIFVHFLLFDHFRENLRSVGEAERLYREGVGASSISDVENMVS